jgi:RimJ/RimL family protein N-acetyltransferase
VWTTVNDARLLLTCGLPAAGKTTLARQLAEDRRALRLTQDEWLIALGSNPWDASIREKVDRELWRLAQEVLRLGVSVVLDFGLWTPGTATRLVARISTSGYASSNRRRTPSWRCSIRRRRRTEPIARLNCGSAPRDSFALHDASCGVAADPSDDVVILRRLSMDDVDAWLAGADDEQIRWFAFPGPATRAHVERAIAAWQESWASEGPVRQWWVCRRPTGELAGGVEVRDLEDGRVNLSYVVFPAHRRHGLATRASRLALDYASRVLGASSAVIKIVEGNEASLGVARRLGADLVGYEPSDAGGRFVVFSLTLHPQCDRHMTDC